MSCLKFDVGRRCTSSGQGSPVLVLLLSSVLLASSSTANASLPRKLRRGGNVVKNSVSYGFAQLRGEPDFLVIGHLQKGDKFFIGSLPDPLNKEKINWTQECRDCLADPVQATGKADADAGTCRHDF